MGVRSGKGDKGLTDLSFHKRVSKASPDICAIGDLDELNSYIGLVKTKLRSRKDKMLFENIQHGISAIASEIAVGGEKKKKLGILLKNEDADWIKNTVYNLESKMNIESHFALPGGGGELAAYLDVTRTVARRAERGVVELLRKDKAKNENILAYLNCISDILFIMARGKARGKRRVGARRRHR